MVIEELECVLKWLEDSDNRWRVANLIAEIIEDVEEIRREL